MPMKEVYVLVPVLKTAMKERKAPELATANADPSLPGPTKPKPESCKRRRESPPSTSTRNKRQKVKAERTSEKQEAQESIAITRTIFPKSQPSRKRQPMSREEYLLSHPHADVQSPTLVVCRLCGTEIKLSSKGTYGPYHWDRHIKHCKEKMNEECASKGNDPAAGASEMKGSIPRKRLRALPGSTPLKLKISRKTRSQDTAPSESDAQPSLEPVVGPPVSQQSDTSYGSIMTPADSHEEPSLIAIRSPSDTSSDEVQSCLLDFKKEVSVPELQWIDGLITTSPQEAVFEENIGPCENASHSNAPVAVTNHESHEKAATLDSLQDHNDINIPLHAQNEESHPGDVVDQESSPRAAPTERDSVTTESSFITLEPAIASPDPDPEDDLEFDYPEWEPGPVSSSFEQELREAGVVIVCYSTEVLATKPGNDEAMEPLPHIVEA